MAKKAVAKKPEAKSAESKRPQIVTEQLERLKKLRGRLSAGDPITAGHLEQLDAVITTLADDGDNIVWGT